MINLFLEYWCQRPHHLVPALISVLLFIPCFIVYYIGSGRVVMATLVQLNHVDSWDENFDWYSFDKEKHKWKGRVPWTSHHQHTGFNWSEHVRQWPEIETEKVNFTEEEICGNYPPGTWTGKLWDQSPDLDNPPGIFPGIQLYASRRAQWELYRHQHPKSCKDARFLIVKALGPTELHGIGSAIHITTAYFLYGLWSNRIILSQPQPGHIWMKGEFCKGHSTWDSCYFLPFSNCSLKDIGMDLNQVPTLSIGDMFNQEINQTQRVMFGFVSRDCKGQLMFVPDFAKKLMAESRLRTETLFYWWRAQGAAYIVRPNKRTMRALLQLRKAAFPQWTILPGTVNVHVRSGDKWKESRLPESQGYFMELDRMVQNYPGHLRKRVFLSTESNETVKYFENQSGWALYYTKADRFDNKTTSPMKHAAAIGADNEMLSSLLNLELALECDAWICLFESNWCRLIDELRSVIRCKAHMPFLAVGWHLYIRDYGW